MNVYNLTAKDLGIRELPDSTIVPSGVRFVDSIADCDVAWCPSSLWGLHTKYTDPLTLKRITETDYGVPAVFCDVSDGDFSFKSKNIFIRCNARSWMRDGSPNTFGFAWPIDPIWSKMAELSESNDSVRDIGFCGWVSSRNCQRAIDSCIRSKHTHHFTQRNTFYGYIERDQPELAKQQWAEHWSCVRDCRLQLVIESIPGVLRYRLLEAMAAARVPVCFISNSVVWPFENEWVRSDCLFQYDIGESSNAGELIKQILDRFDDNELRQMGRNGRSVWSQWFDRRRWSELAVKVVQKAT